MSRLFWKVLAFTLLAQTIAGLGMTAVLWLNHARETDGMARRAMHVDGSPPAAFLVDAAAATLHHGGVDALRALLRDGNPRHMVLTVDARGQELLGRPVNPQALAQAYQLANTNAPYAPPEHMSARTVTGADGETYLLFVPMSSDDTAMLRPPHDGRFPPLMPLLPLLSLATTLLASLLAATLLARYFAKPIDGLRAAFSALAEGVPAVSAMRLIGARSDELADLGRDFDAMAQRLGALLDGQRRLLHDVSHELRSPLARLQAAIGLARQQPDKTDAMLTRIEIDAARIEKLIGELLALARLEAGAVSPARDEVDLDALLAIVSKDAHFEAQATNRRIEIEGDTAGKVWGDSDLLQRALENLVRNALRYSPPGQPLTLESALNADAGNWRLTVLDRGPGVPESELEAIFEPFYRCTLNAGEGNTSGYGLGLAIARRIIEAHGGLIRAYNRPGGGLAMEILLPMRASQTT